MLGFLAGHWAEPEAQLGFIRSEAIERGDWQATCSEPTAVAATAVWAKRFERGHGIERRLAAARWIEGLMR